MLACLMRNMKISFYGFFIYFALVVSSSKKNNLHLNNNSKKIVPELNCILERKQLEKYIPIKVSSSKNVEVSFDRVVADNPGLNEYITFNNSSFSQNKITNVDKKETKSSCLVKSFEDMSFSEQQNQINKVHVIDNKKNYYVTCCRPNDFQDLKNSILLKQRPIKEKILQEYIVHLNIKLEDITQREFINFMADKSVNLKSYLEISKECKNAYYKFILLGFHETLLPTISECFTFFKHWKYSYERENSALNLKEFMINAYYLKLLASDIINRILNKELISRTNRYAIMKKIFEKEKNDIEDRFLKTSTIFIDTKCFELTPEKDFENLMLAFLQVMNTYQRIIILSPTIKYIRIFKSQIYIFSRVFKDFLDNFIKKLENQYDTFNKTSLKSLNNIIKSNNAFLKKNSYQKCCIEEATDTLFDGVLIIICTFIHINNKTKYLDRNKLPKEKKYGFVYELILNSNKKIDYNFRIFKYYAYVIFEIANSWYLDFLVEIDKNDKLSENQNEHDKNKIYLDFFFIKMIRNLFLKKEAN